LIKEKPLTEANC